MSEGEVLKEEERNKEKGVEEKLRGREEGRGEERQSCKIKCVTEEERADTRRRNRREVTSQSLLSFSLRTECYQVRAGS